MTPATTANPSQRMLLNTMPIWFTVISFGFASGLVLYWLTNNVLTILQQWIYQRLKKAGYIGGLETVPPIASTGRKEGTRCARQEAMSEPPREFFTGSSLEQAVLVAAQHYGVEPDDLAYERVERRYGFLRQRRNVVIKVDPKTSRCASGACRRRAAASPVEPEIDETPQLETQKDFNLHRDRRRRAWRIVPSVHRRNASRVSEIRGVRGASAGPGGTGGQRGQGGQRPPRPMRRRVRGTGRRRSAVSTAKHRGEARGGGQRRRRRRRGARAPCGGDRQGGERSPVDAVAMDFVPEPRNLPLAEGATAELAAATARQLAALGGLDLEVEVLQGETELEVELSGPIRSSPVRERRSPAARDPASAAALDAAGRGWETAAAYASTVQGFRTQRVASLERLAREAAEEVRRRGRPKTLHSMNPSDRRIVHLALKDAEGVVTESNGDGFFKRITVRPA